MIKSMKNKKMWIIIAVVAVVVIWFVSLYNGLVDREQKVDEAWANVETTYQRRADLIPNLVSTVRGYATHEQETFLRTVQARAASATLDPATATEEQMQEWLAAQDEVRSAISVVVEAYPELRSSENFLSFQDELAGTENRISTERRRYNEAVREYNVKLRRFPTNLVASMFGFEPRVMFAASEGAEVAPEVVF